MSAQQQLVGAAGIGLVVVNVWTGQQRKDLAAVLGGDGDTAAAHTAAKQVGLELLGVGLVTLLAGAGKGAGNAACAVLGALWVLWLIKNTDKIPGAMTAARGIDGSTTGIGSASSVAANTAAAGNTDPGNPLYRYRHNY